MHTLASSYIGFAILFVSSKIIQKRIGEGLIDDTGLMVSSQSSTDITSACVKRFTPDEDVLFSRMKKMVQLFLELLQVDGGYLNISKCACFTVFHRWKGGRATLLRTHDSHSTMTITHPPILRHHHHLDHVASTSTTRSRPSPRVISCFIFSK
jgi:hypothetical protein